MVHVPKTVFMSAGVTGTAEAVFAAAGAAVRPPAGVVDRPPELVCAA
jgi:hypothetical protein